MKKIYLSVAMCLICLMANSQQRFVVINNSDIYVRISYVETAPNTFDVSVAGSEYPKFLSNYFREFAPMETEVFENSTYAFSFPFDSSPEPMLHQWLIQEDQESIPFGPMGASQTNNLAGGNTLNEGQKLYMFRALYFKRIDGEYVSLPGSNSITPYSTNPVTFDTDGENYTLNYFEMNTGSDKIYMVVIENF